MKNKKRLIGILLAAIIGLALSGAVPAIRHGREEPDREEVYTTLEEMAYDKSGRKTLVYLKENGEYIPYLVLESDYGGNVLLLRENVLPEPMQYEPATHEGERGSPLNGGWACPRDDPGSYYEESSIDVFLSTDFPEVFSPGVQAAMVDTTIEVTDMESYQEEHWAEVTHLTQRKVFLLSAVELGITFSIGYCITEEGAPLKYFENTVYSVKNARAADGTVWPNWTRTPWISERYTVTVICIDALGAAPADSKIGVRPAFCLGKDTAVHRKDGIFAEKSVYVLDLEEE